ncbi:MAG: DUF429 domain-containing protein [Synechococcaceae cyanobacterium SM2_3_2]|nr:DUF429 domain-containing protein [Synechococcaceae cyanobacterium SM2_3_2]
MDLKPLFRKHPLTIYIGLDLAWSPHNRSGAAVIEAGSETEQMGGTLVDVALLSRDDEILAYIQKHQGSQTWVAVDAPLRVPNLTGRRPAEAEISQAFRRFHAGAHPANRTLLMREGVVRGEALVAALAELGIPYLTQFEPGSSGVVEVFPHPATVAIFGLDKILPYKARPRRDLATRQIAWGQYQNYLRGLNNGDPWLSGTDALLAQDVAQLKGNRLKAYEDQVDAVMCAYIALYAHRWGSQRCRVFGSFDQGSIYTPVPLNLRRDEYPT